MNTAGTPNGACQRAARAGADIGRGASRDSPVTQGCPTRAEPDTGDALRHQFAIGAMTAAGQCRRTTADSGDSIAASNANAIASGITRCAFPARMRASRRRQFAGMPPKRLPMVSTGGAKANGRPRRNNHRHQDAGPVPAQSSASPTMIGC